MDTPQLLPFLFWLWLTCYRRMVEALGGRRPRISLIQAYAPGVPRTNAVFSRQWRVFFGLLVGLISLAASFSVMGGNRWSDGFR